jgi:hypothetical protein
MTDIENRIALLRTLLSQGDWAAAHRWLDQWEQEDSAATLTGSGAALSQRPK